MPKMRLTFDAADRENTRAWAFDSHRSDHVQASRGRPGRDRPAQTGLEGYRGRVGIRLREGNRFAQRAIGHATDAVVMLDGGVHDRCGIVLGRLKLEGADIHVRPGLARDQALVRGQSYVAR